MKSADDQATAAAMLGGGPMTFNALLSMLMSSSNADRDTIEAAFHRLRASYQEALVLRLVSSLTALTTPADLHAMAGILLCMVLFSTPSSSDASSNSIVALPVPL